MDTLALSFFFPNRRYRRLCPSRYDIVMQRCKQRAVLCRQESERGWLMGVVGGDWDILMHAKGAVHYTVASSPGRVRYGGKGNGSTQDGTSSLSFRQN
jgi:hypothetical protein